jgi:Peptidase A4 family
MTGKPMPEKTKLRLYPPPPKNFDPFAATKQDLLRHGVPLRPDPHAQPGLAALWDRLASRYRTFDHLEPHPDTTTADKKGVIATAPLFGPDPTESCGYQLMSSAPITALFVTWTVPDLQYTPSPLGTDYFHTFVGLGFLDLHVEITVDSAQNVTCQVWAQDIGNINLPVRPGDVISASLCLETNEAGTAAYFLTNETTSQTISFSVDTGFPPAVTINAGVTRSWPQNQPFPPLARFGVVYFDEISAFSTSGTQSLTSGDAITMVDQNGGTLARPVRLTDYTFKVVFG